MIRSARIATLRLSPVSVLVESTRHTTFAGGQRDAGRNDPNMFRPPTQRKKEGYTVPEKCIIAIVVIVIVDFFTGWSRSY